MELQTCIRTRRSVRQFTDEPVSHAALEQVIALAAWAPSWKNTQISRYMAIEDPEVLQTICAQYVSPFKARVIGVGKRSEERRGEKECRSRGPPYH